MEFPPDYRPKARPNLLFKELSDGGIIYEPQTETIHSLNASSSFIWVLCDGEHTLTDIAQLIKNSFNQFTTSPEEAVLIAVQKFQQLNLLCPIDATIPNK